MNYLTQYYKNRCLQLQEQVNSLQYQIAMLAEGPQVAGGAGEDAMSVEGPAGGPGGVASMGAAGNAGGGAPSGQFSGAVLGQLLGAGDMQAVANYLAQFYPNNPSALAAIMASLGVNVGGPAGGPGGSLENVAKRVMTAAGDSDAVNPGSNMGPGPFSGANLGQLLGAGNMQAVNNYVNQYSPGGGYVAGPAAMSQTMGNKARGVMGRAGRGSNAR